MIDGLIQMTFNKKKGSTITLYVKVKQYTREKGKEEYKYLIAIEREINKRKI